jgi:hypothetical protein
MDGSETLSGLAFIALELAVFGRPFPKATKSFDLENN